MTTRTRADVLAAELLEAVARRDRAAELHRLAKAYQREQRAQRRADRLERAAQRAAWPKCGAPRADGQPCEARALWLAGEVSPRTRCRHHGGAQSPNVPPILQTGRPTVGRSTHTGVRAPNPPRKAR